MGTTLTDDEGRKSTLEGNARRTADTRGVEKILVSISHEKHYATATVILCGK